MGKKADDSIVIQPKAVCTEEELPVFLKDSLKLGAEAAEQYFKMTITNGTETKEALLTFANGKTAGWSSVANESAP